MSSVQSLKKEIDSLKKNQNKLLKRISAIEKGAVLDDEPIEIKKTSSKEKENTTPAGAIVLMIIGALLFFVEVWYLGMPLFIWGLILAVSNYDSSSSSKKSVKKLKKRTSQVESKKTVKSKTKKKETTFEEDIGMKWFARIGILALVIGVGFFIKYAIDMSWINHLTRIVMGVVFGIGVIVFGEIISKKKKYDTWAKTLVGGGFAITYFAVFAAYHFKEYQLAIGISQTVDIILLSLVVLFSIFLSLKDNSKIIAAESFFLGYVTSFLSNDFGLMTIIYSLLLTIGLVTVVSYKKWSVIGLGGMIASYLLFLVWSTKNPSSFVYASFILISYFIAFTIQLFSLIKKKELVGKNMVLLLANSAFFFILYYFQIDKHYSDYAGLFTLFFSIFYFAGYMVSQTLKEKVYATTHLYLALLYLTLTIPIQLNGVWITTFWAVEALILTLIFLKLKIKTLKIGSYIVGIIAGIKTLLYDTTSLHELNLVNIFNSERLFSFAVTIICFYTIYKLLNNNEILSKNEYYVALIYSWVATGFLVLITFLELIDDYAVWVSIILAFLGIIYLIVSDLNKKEYFYQSVCISWLLFAKVVFYDSWNLNVFSLNNFFSSTLFFSFITATLVLYLMKWIIKNNKSLAKTDLGISLVYSWMASGLIVFLTFIELFDDYAVWVSVVLSILAIVYLLLFDSKTKEYLYQSITISGILFLKILFYDSWYLSAFSSNDFFSSTRFFAFILTILTLYVMSWTLEKKKKTLNKSEASLINLYSYAGTILAFILVLIEMEEFWISVGWTVLALIITMSGFMLRKKQLRMQGMLIFTIVIIKVFLYDTRNLETIYRTVSYMVLGVILLLVSFIYTKYKEKLKEIL